jgi:hypothetical protein
MAEQLPGIQSVVRTGEAHVPDGKDDQGNETGPKTDVKMDDVDDIVYQTALEEGHQDGKQAAETASLKEGQRLGQVTGVDYGMEIGFAMGLVEAVKEWLVTEMKEKERQKGQDENVVQEGTTLLPTTQHANTSQIQNASSIHRMQKSVDDLEAAIQEFPRIQQLFFENENGESGSNRVGKIVSDTFTTSSSSQQSNIREALQRIRARTKVLTAKLGLPHHSLKSVLQEQGPPTTTPGTLPSSSNEKEDAAKLTGSNKDVTNEW